MRDSIYSSKKNLKSEEENVEKLSIIESLTKRRLALVEEARNAFGFRNVELFTVMYTASSKTKGK